MFGPWSLLLRISFANFLVRALLCAPHSNYLVRNAAEKLTPRRALGASIAQLYLLLRHTASEDTGAPGRVAAFVWIIMPIEASLVIIAASLPTLQALCPSRFPPPLPRVEEPSTSQSTSDHDLSQDITIHHIPKDVYPSDSSLMAKSMRGFGYTNTEIRPGSRKAISTGGIMRTMDVDVAFGERRAEDGIRAVTWGWT